MDWRGRRYWLVGASEGLGRALARALSDRGAELVISARNETALQDLADSLPGPVQVVAMDVGDGAAVRAAAAQVGVPDGVIWLAGVYWPMRAQDWNPDQAEAMADVNFTGCLRVLGQVVPGMVARGSGHVVITGSLAGFRGLPGAVGYGASKAACMSLAETLALDLRGTGVRVQLANPGYIRTRLTAKNGFAMPQIMQPEVAADHMLRLMESGRFASSFPTPFQWLFRLANLMPDALYFKLFAPRSGKG